MAYKVLPVAGSYLSLTWTCVLQSETGEGEGGKKGRDILNPFPVAHRELTQDGCATQTLQGNPNPETGPSLIPLLQPSPFWLAQALPLCWELDEQRGVRALPSEKTHATTKCNTDLALPGLYQVPGFVIPVLGHGEQLLQLCHRLLHRRVGREPHAGVYEAPHIIQSEGAVLWAGQLHILQPACLLQPRPQLCQLRQVHVKVKADIQQLLQLRSTGHLFRKELLALLLESFHTVEEILKYTNAMIDQMEVLFQVT